jgi:hypothetical protein
VSGLFRGIGQQVSLYGGLTSGLRVYAIAESIASIQHDMHIFAP